MTIVNKQGIFRSFGGGRCEVDLHLNDYKATITGETSNYNTSTGTGSWNNLDRTHEGLNNSLLSCTVEKRMGEPFGTFSISLINTQNSNGRTWLDVLRPRQLVVIKMTGASSETYSIKTKPVMIGFIDQINKKGSYNSNTPTQVITIQGSDVGKALYDARLYYYYFHDLGGQVYKNLDKVIPYGKQNEVIKKVVETLFYDAFDMEFYFGDSQGLQKTSIATMKNLIGYKLGFSDGKLLNYNEMLLPQSPLWTILKNFSNAPFNEIFIDLIDEDEINSYVGDTNSITKEDSNWISIDGHRVYIVFRPTPFISRLYGDGSRETKAKDSLSNLDPKDKNGEIKIWHSLPTITIQDKDIIEDNLTYSSHEVYNYFGVGAEWLANSINRNGSPLDSGAQGSKILAFNDIYNLQSIRKFGLKQLLVDLKVVPGDIIPEKDRFDVNKLDNSNFLIRYGTLLHDWYAYNHEYRSGSFLLQGNPEIQIGKLLKFEERIDGRTAKWNYYVQGVRHEFIRDNKGGHLYTNVEVTRGLDENEPLIYFKVKEDYRNKKSSLSSAELKAHVVSSARDQVNLQMELTKKAIEKIANEQGTVTEDGFIRGIVKKHSQAGFTSIEAKHGLELMKDQTKMKEQKRNKE